MGDRCGMLEEIRVLVRRAAREEILPRFNRVQHGTKADGSVITEADLAVQARLILELEQAYPNYRLLGEEMETAAQQALLAAPGEGLWILDPVDGTANFAAGIPYFCVSLALLDDAGPRLGVVYDPVRDECFSAERGQGAWCNGEPLHSPASRPLAQCIAEVDLKRLPPGLAARVAAEAPFRSQRNFGAGALDWCWLAAGRFQLYLHGGQKLWDYAAGSLILGEAGGWATTLEGEPVHVAGMAAGEGRSVVAAGDPAGAAAWRAVLQG